MLYKEKLLILRVVVVVVVVVVIGVEVTVAIIVSVSKHHILLCELKTTNVSVINSLIKR